jgi:hypothetical protein
MSGIINSFLMAAILFSVCGNVKAQKNWKDITSVEDLCENYRETMINMFDHFNLEYKGLEKVKAANDSGNLVGACNYLLEFYKNGNTAQGLRMKQLAKTDKTDALADTILNNVFVIQNVRGQVPYGEDGHRDWYYKGPNNDSEWAWLSNRHSQINQVLTAYFETGNPKYAKYIDLFLRDFIIKSMPYPAAKSSTSVWRGLEASFRAKVWSRIFYGLINSEYLSPATELLILSSLPDHAHYNRNFHGGNNWLTMEISALATVATNFPEYKGSGEWLAYSIETMTASMKDQVYADGVQTELTSHYHSVALSNFELFKDICDNANKALPDFFNRTIEDMYSYLAHTIRPDGFRILNNDGDRGSDRDRILNGSKKYHNNEWEYLATNGRCGTEPSQGPSFFYPWAGQLISRSGYDADAHWSFFDIGPWGSGHQHNDKLHISISAYGRDLLVDAGRFAYTGEVARKFRPYARSSSGHNIVLIDGKGQGAGPTHARVPLDKHSCLITDDFDHATNSFDRFMDVDGEMKHIRSVFYVRGEFWVVVDRIMTDRPRKIDALWHWHPECVVQKDHLTVKTNNKKGNLAIVPVSKQAFDITLIKGQEEPGIQGWYSPEYNIFEPNVTSVYSTEISENTTFVWLLLPSKEGMPKIRAEIMAEDEYGVKIGVKSKKKNWQLDIPYTDSQDAKLLKH